MDALTIRRMRGQVPVQPAAVKTSKAAPSTAAQRTARPGVTVSAALGELLSRSGQIESRYREDRRTLQTGEAVLSKVRDALGRMAELAEKAAGDGDIDRDALQAGLERLTDEVERMLTGAFAGKTPLFLDEGAEPGGGVEALLRAVFSEASAGTEAARSLPEWLGRGLTAGELAPERIREALGLDPSAGAEEIFAALAKRPLEDETAGYLAALYLGAVIAGGTEAPDPSEALEGLRQLLEKIASGVEPDAAVEELTGGAFTGLEDFSEQFTGLTAPGLRQFLLDLLTPELGSPEAPVLSGMPLMNLLAGMEGVRLDLLMGLLTALQSGESAPAAGDPAANPEAQAALQTAQAAQAASGTAPDAPSAPVTVAQMGNMQVIGRDLSGVAFDEATGVLTVGGSADVVLQGTDRGEQAVVVTGSGTVTFQDAAASKVTVLSPEARIHSTGTSFLWELTLAKGTTLTLGGGGTLRLGTVRADGSNTLRLTGGAVIAEAREGEKSAPLTVPVVIDGPVSFAARAHHVTDPAGRTLEPFDVIWKAMLPGFRSLSDLALNGQHARLNLLNAEPPDPLRLWLLKGDLSAHGYPAHGLVLRGRDASGRVHTRYAYLQWSQGGGGVEEAAMYPNPFTVTGGEEGTDWVYESESHTLRILTDQVTALSGGAGTDRRREPFSGRVALADGIGALSLTLGGVACRVETGRAFDLGADNAVTLLLQGGTESIFESGPGHAGITLGAGTTLTIDRAEAKGSGVEPGKLTATGGDGGAGIGRDASAGKERTGSIRILGGAVTAAGSGGGAGIGAGRRGAMGSVTISGGTVFSAGETGGAGIGGALGAPVGDIRIDGGTVDATAHFHAAAIGAGVQGESGDIHITGMARIARAQGGDPGADIGACLFGRCGRVVISGGADIGRARLRTESGIPLQIGADTVTLPQFRLSARALRLRKMSLAAQDAARAAQDILDADCQWVTQIQAAYGALYRQLERGIGGFRSQRPEEAAGPIRGVQAAGALLSEMRQAIPRPESQAMSTHGRRGMEEARQLLG